MTSTVPKVVDPAAAAWGADTIVLDADTPSVQVIAADPQRRSCTIVTDANSTGIVYVSPSGGVKSGGLRLVPGSGFTFNTTAPIYARSEGGAQIVTVQSETGWNC